MRTLLAIFDTKIEIKIKKISSSPSNANTHITIKELEGGGHVEITLFEIEPRGVVSILKQAISECENSLEEELESSDDRPERHNRP